jgi:hypothetical protein
MMKKIHSGSKVFWLISILIAVLSACGGNDQTSLSQAATKLAATGPASTAAIVAAAAAVASPVWLKCANEDGVCTFSGTTTVRYGLSGKYVTKTATNSIGCNNQVFGDPYPNADKICEYDTSLATPPPPSATWVRCANEDALCVLTGSNDVRYGSNGIYFFRTVNGSVQCSNAIFGDPAFGADKFCDYRAAQGTTKSAWSPVIPFPIVPVAAANLPNGKVLTWSSYSPTTFSGTDNGKTYSSIFDPVAQTSTNRIVSETSHDMFCPGTSLLADGRLLVSGGVSSAKTSIYNFANDSWTVAANMNTPRGYQSNVTLSDGSVLTLGGSWSGPVGGKNGEIWTPGGAWRLMSGIPIGPFVGPDPDGMYRGDNHLWLFAQANGKVFHAGPSANMNWIDTTNNGKVSAAGTRSDDVYSMNGNAVMYDIGKILKTGGAPAYENVVSRSASYVINIGTGTATVKKIAPMNYARAMHNSVVLPNGQVVISGGQTYVKIFSDDQSVLMAEIWDPKTETFTNLSPMAVPRNYHSFSLLLPDGRVLIGGGGLCDFSCTANHLDAQILTPPYLSNSDGSDAIRPAIISAPSKGSIGAVLAVATDSAVTSFSLMRMSSVTHSLNNDQRRVPLKYTATDATHYSLQIPGNAGIVPPGFYMLFAMNTSGVPSYAKNIQIQ